MKTNSKQTNQRFWLSAAIGLALLVLFTDPRIASAQQWTGPDGSNNISNANSGNVGVGLTVPLYKFDVLSGSNIIARFGSTAAVNNQVLFNAPSGYNSNLTLQNGGVSKWYLGNRAANDRFSLIESTGTVEVFSILQNGNVGIGTITPAYKLDLLGGYFHTTYNTQSHPASSSSGGLAIGWNRHPGSAEVNFYNVYDNAAISYQFSQKTGASTATDLMTILGNGKVGIGTANPQRTLDASTSGQITFGDDGHTSSGSPGVYWVSGNTYGLYKTPGSWTAPNYQQLEMIFATGIVIDGGSAYGKSGTVLQPNGGNVGIGTSTPGYKLDVAGDVRSNTGFRFPNGTLQTTAATMTGVTAGAGLTGGGTSGAATLDIGQGTGVTVAADSISVNYGSTSGTAVEGNKQITVTTDGSSGLSGGASVTIGSGGTLTLNNADKGSSQNIFKNIANAGGTTQFSAGSNNDAVRFAGTGGSTVSFDTGTKKITIDSSGIISSQWTTSGNNINYGTAGNVGIGNASPTTKLDVTGNGHFTGNLTVDGNIAAKYQDMAEWVPSSEQLTAGTVVVLDSTKSNQVISSSQPYDTRVAGVISEQPGIALGESGAGKVLVATTGRVLVQADAGKSPIHIGDLLVTSDVPGVAMKSEPVNLGGVQLHRPGTLIGKALEPLEKGRGKILVLLVLQ